MEARAHYRKSSFILTKSKLSEELHAVCRYTEAEYESVRAAAQSLINKVDGFSDDDMQQILKDKKKITTNGTINVPFPYYELPSGGVQHIL